MKKTILLLFSLCLMAITTAQALTVASTAGGLSTAITTASGNLSTLTNLTITGTIDARDFVVMRDSMPKLASLNLSAVTIAPYTGTGGTEYSKNGSDSSCVYTANAIPNYAFYNVNTVGNASLTSITIPSSVTSIGYRAFSCCTGLISITIPSSVTSIGAAAFLACGALTPVTISSSVTSIGLSAFYNCNALITVDANNPNYSSADGVLFNKNKTILIQCPTSKTGSYVIPSSVDSIGYGGFDGCFRLTSITIPSSVTSIGAVVFAVCTGLTSITIPSSVTSIGYDAFGGCGLTSITIPSSVTSIENSAFYACYALTSVTIPSSVTAIGANAFGLCTGLTSIYAYPTTPVDLSSVEYVFDFVNTTTCTLYVPTNSINLYKAANQWKDFNIVATTATAVQQIKDNVSIFPNPVINNFNISGLSAPQTLQLFDLNGKLIFSQQVDNGTVPASFLQTGIYILKIGSFETKIIKQ